MSDFQQFFKGKSSVISFLTCWLKCVPIFGKEWDTCMYVCVYIEWFSLGFYIKGSAYSWYVCLLMNFKNLGLRNMSVIDGCECASIHPQVYFTIKLELVFKRTIVFW